MFRSDHRPNRLRRGIFVPFLSFRNSTKSKTSVCFSGGNSRSFSSTCCSIVIGACQTRLLRSYPCSPVSALWQSLIDFVTQPMPMDFNTYYEKDGLTLGEMVRRGEVTALDLLETAIARAEAVNPKLNAVVYRGYEQARAAAKAFKPDGQPFAGVPLLLKDITGFCSGMPTRAGSAFVPDTPATADSFLVSHFRRTGFIPFAK